MKEQLDYSNNSTNPYTVELRHGLIPTCMVCHKFIPVILDGSDYYRFFMKNAAPVQEIFPYLTASQREVLLTGIHPACWDEMFKEEGEYES